jgi:ribosomal protein L24
LTGPEIVLDAIDKKTGWGAICNALPKTIAVKIGQSLRVVRGELKGTIGTLIDVAKSGNVVDALHIQTETGEVVNVARISATSTHTLHNTREKQMATRQQFPVKTSFGLTVHGVQGKSIRCFQVGCAGFWEHGQAYVALSRSSEPAMMQLLDADKLQFICDARVQKFYTSIASQKLPSYAVDDY